LNPKDPSDAKLRNHTPFPKKILLIRLRRAGDIVMTTPAVRALKQAYPQAEISYLVEAPYGRLVEGHPDLDSVIAFDKERGIRGFFRLLRDVRKKRCNLVIDFHGGPRASLITASSRAAKKIGYRVKYRSFLYHTVIPRGSREKPVHSVENHANLVRAAGVKIDELPSLSLPAARPEEVQRIREFFKENSLGQAKVVILHIGAGNEFRDWGIENILEFVRLAAGIPGVRTILVGSEEEKPAEKVLLAGSPVPLLSLVGRVNLAELKEVIASSSLFVGPDSGPMHIAASTGTPIVAYFGPTLPAHFSPWKAKSVLLEKPMDCRPCRQKKCLSGDFRCLRSITPEEVFTACLPFLKK
jgi:heptosyltransferase-1